jgi:hypothetical protein
MPFARQAPPGRQPAPQEEPRDRIYVVVGPREVGGKVKGEEVVLCLTDAAEAALIEAGHVEPIKPQFEAPPTERAPLKK